MGTPVVGIYGGMSEKVWFITGTSRGFGREWTKAALERGDKVAATARDVATLDDLASTYGSALLPLQLDVTTARPTSRRSSRPTTISAGSTSW